MTDSYIALGSNLHFPFQQIRKAYKLLCTEKNLHHCRCSSLYRSKAMSLRKNKIQPDYINAVVSFQTDVSPSMLLVLTQRIERIMGRDSRAAKWSPRIIDLDILSMKGIIVKSFSLTLPHPGLMTRSFVIFPLAEIAPKMILPNNMTTVAYSRNIRDDWKVRRLSSGRECN